MDHLLSVTDATFDTEVLAQAGDTLVELRAPWCPPCDALQPVLAAITKDRPSLKVVVVDIDASPAIAKRYQVRGTPTLLLFRGGEKRSTRIGATTKEKLLAWIDEVSS